MGLDAIASMKSPLLIALVLSASNAFADSSTNAPPPITNLVEVLPYVERFGKALKLDIPQPLTTNDITKSKYSKLTRTFGLTIGKTFTFEFNANDRLVDSFTDKTHSMIILWREQDIKPLLKPSLIAE